MFKYIQISPKILTFKTKMQFHTRKLVKPEDLNANGILFGGKLIAWIDEEAALFTIVLLNNPKVVTKFISEINFMSAAKQGDIVEIGIDVAKFGNSSVVLKSVVRNMMTKETIITIDNITMVNLNENEKPSPHGKTLSDL